MPPPPLLVPGRLPAPEPVVVAPVPKRLFGLAGVKRFAEEPPPVVKRPLLPGAAPNDGPAAAACKP